MLHAIEIKFLAFLKELGVYDETTNLDVGAFGKFASVIHDESFVPNTGFIMGTSGWVPQDGYLRMGASGWVPQDGCLRMGTSGWVPQDGYLRMGDSYM